MNSHGIDLREKLSDFFVVIDKLHVIYLGTFVLQQAYCNIASGKSRNTLYRLGSRISPVGGSSHPHPNPLLEGEGAVD